jgi:4-alpha-glucanotransferase
MNSDTPVTNLPPFPPDYRACGVLLHVTSLPSPYGIGDLGPAAFAWIDFLREAGQTWWQALPGVPPDMPTHHTNPYLPSPATGFS